MYYADLAVEELKMLQEIIGRHESHAMRIKGLLFVIIAGVTAAIYTKDLEVSRSWMLFGSTILTLLFMVWELYHRALSQQAIIRSGQVEAQLRKELEYDGPLIGHALSHKIRVEHLWAEACRPWNWTSLIVVWASLFFLFFFAPPSKDGKCERQLATTLWSCPTFDEIRKFSPVRKILSDCR